MSTKDDLIRTKINNIFQEVMGLIHSALNDAVALGDIPEMDTHEAAQAIWAYWREYWTEASSVETSRPIFHSQAV
ncbi:MAG: hypothetical protein CME25_13775 [Gemmatimonadetes bacterium]|nr:hypothetical protein [Gemmatimonadota bacterium]